MGATDGGSRRSLPRDSHGGMGDRPARPARARAPRTSPRARAAAAARPVDRLAASVYRTLFERSPEPHLVQTLDGTIVDANDAAAALYGWPRKELIGQSYYVTISEDDRVLEAGARNELLEAGWFRRRVRAARRDGTAFPQEVVGALVTVGEQRFALIHVTDISAGRALEEAAHQLGELARLADEPLTPDMVGPRAVEVLATTFGAAGVVLAMLDEGRIRLRATAGQVDPAAIERFLQERESTVLERILSTRRARALDVSAYRSGRRSGDGVLTDELAEAGLVAAWLVPVVAGDDHRGLLALLFAAPPPRRAFDAGRLANMGRIVGIALGNAWLREEMRAEIERRGRLEAAARLARRTALASEQRYRTLFEESPDPLTLQDPDGRIVDANHAALRLYGATPDWLIGRSAGEVGASEGIPDDGQVEQARWVRRGIGTRADGSTFPEEAIVSRIEIDGQPRDLVRIRDLTEQEQLQQELVQAQKMEAIGQLVSGVAHELNNPLAAIIAFSQLLRRDPRLPDDMRRDADLLVGEADRTRRIVQNLLDFARQRPPERHPTNLRPLVTSVLELQAYTLNSGQIRVELDLPDALPPVPLDRAQMQQVLLNVTLNALQAIRASGKAGTVRIAAREEADQGRRTVRLTISDDGPGVAPQDRDRLFVPFFTTKEPGEGTGLGLPVSFGIVAAHGGQLTYEPGPDGGSTFAITLPIDPNLRSSGPSVASERETEPSPAPPAPRGNGPSEAPRPRVLVLDDEPSIRAFLAKALRSGGFEAVVTEDGEAAVEAVRGQPFAAVLCDHRMAGMTGTDVFEAIVGIRPELAQRFIFMSGDVLNPDLAAFAGDRDLALLPKPFDLDAVHRAVRRVVDR